MGQESIGVDEARSKCIFSWKKPWPSRSSPRKQIIWLYVRGAFHIPVFPIYYWIPSLVPLPTLALWLSTFYQTYTHVYLFFQDLLSWRHLPSCWKLPLNTFACLSLTSWLLLHRPLPQIQDELGWHFPTPAVWTCSGTVSDTVLLQRRNVSTSGACQEPHWVGKGQRGNLSIIHASHENLFPKSHNPEKSFSWKVAHLRIPPPRTAPFPPVFWKADVPERASQEESHLRRGLPEESAPWDKLPQRRSCAQWTPLRDLPPLGKPPLAILTDSPRNSELSRLLDLEEKTFDLQRECLSSLTPRQLLKYASGVFHGPNNYSGEH